MAQSVNITSESPASLHKVVQNLTDTVRHLNKDLTDLKLTLSAKKHLNIAMTHTHLLMPGGSLPQTAGVLYTLLQHEGPAVFHHQSLPAFT